MKRLIVTCFLLLATFCCYSQWSTTISGTFSVGTVLNISFSNQAAAPSFTNASDYQSGKTTLHYSTIAIKSNVDWIISFKAQNTYFTPQTIGASNNMPAGVLGLRVNGNASFITMTTASQTLKTGNNGDVTATGNTFYTDMFFNPGFNYNGGLYSMDVLYTVSQQ